MAEKYKPADREVTHRVERKLNGTRVWAEISDRSDKCEWRLCTEEFASQWTGYYEGVLTLSYNERIFAYCSAYWTGDIPTEEPFEIVPGKTE